MSPLFNGLQKDTVCEACMLVYDHPLGLNKQHAWSLIYSHIPWQTLSQDHPDKEALS
jgi:hypothetical protein